MYFEGTHIFNTSDSVERGCCRIKEEVSNNDNKLSTLFDEIFFTFGDLRLCLNEK